MHIFLAPFSGLFASFSALAVEGVLYIVFFTSSGVLPNMETPAMSLIIAFAIIEEASRFFFLSRSVAHQKTWSYNMLVFLFFGIGFAGFEWILKAAQFSTMQNFSAASWYPAVFHIALSIIVGTGILFGTKNRIWVLWLAFSIAALLHVMYNTSIANIAFTQ